MTCPPEEGETSFFTLWLFNIAMENGPFIDGLSINSMVDLSMANCECHNQMVRPHAPGHNKIGDRGARRLASLLDPDYCLQALLGRRLVRPHRGLAHFKSCCGETLVGPFLENDL